MIESIRSLRLVDASFGYDGAAPIFDNVTYDFPMGRRVWLSSTGRRGRTTALRIMAALEAPKSGSLRMNERNVTEMSFEEFLPYRIQIGFSFDFGGLMANRTLWQNLMLPLEYHRDLGPEEARERVAELCRAFDLWDARDSRPASVSGSARKACSVARAFVMDPEVLLLDDPLIALGEAAIAATARCVSEGRKNGRLKHVFFTAQDEAQAKRLGFDEVVDIEKWRAA